MPNPISEPHPPAPAQPTAPPRRKKRFILLPILILLALGGGIWGLLWYLDARHFETTDDAFLDAHIVQVSPRIAGHVVRVLVEDNQLVQAGDPVVELDSTDLQTKVNEAQGNLNAALARREEANTNRGLTAKTAEADKQKADAALVAAQTAVETAKAVQAQAEAQIVADKANAEKARLDLERYTNLLKTGDITRQQLDATTAEAATADAHLAVARKAVVSAQALVSQAQAKVTEAQAEVAAANVVKEREAVTAAQYATADAQIEQFQAALAQAKLNVSYTAIHAPVAGRVTRRAVETGHYVVEGQAMFALVPQEMYVTANFKETQLRHMKIGQEVVIRVDAYPDEVLKGKVDSFQQGSGARFSMLPPENATGNYVKVVQRVPVKITFTEPFRKDRDYAPGESVEPRVKVR